MASPAERKPAPDAVLPMLRAWATEIREVDFTDAVSLETMRALWVNRQRHRSVAGRHRR
ncbi:hypothetical protein [Amycolatopsis sp. cmx-11-12]|uniref:hypothetical protein n=1 Tax=Amycolatopsis sp. cmx-11-12 TaxID=2785795 RepID=UPI003917B829